MTKSNREKGFAPVHNGFLFYEVAGSGPVVLLIHAGVADNNMWSQQFDLFSRQFRVIRYDTRGYGKSRTETTSFSNRQDIMDLFNHLGIDQASIIGISRGGQIAIDFTLEHPEYVVSLVAVAAGVGGFEWQPDHSERSQLELQQFSRMSELWEKKAFDELADLEVHVWVDGPTQPQDRASPQLRNYVRKIVRANYTRKDGDVSPQVLEPPAVGRLGEIHVPTLVLVGEYDALETHATAEKLEQDIPGAHRLLIPGTAHMIPMEKPDEFNRAVLNFLPR